MITSAAQVVFGASGNASSDSTHGHAEWRENASWRFGPDATLRVKLAPGDSDLLVQCVLERSVGPPAVNVQRLTLTAQGATVGSVPVHIDSAVAFRVGRHLLGNCGEVNLSLHSSDAAGPLEASSTHGTRPLAFAVREARAIWVPPETPFHPRRMAKLRAVPAAAGDLAAAMAPAVRALTGLSVHDLMARMESLGYNCELGLIQKRCGANPPGLLRFAGLGVKHLLDGLEAGFEGVDDPAATRLLVDNAEWVVENTRYGARWHSFRPAVEDQRDAVLRDELRKLAFMRRRFMDVLETGPNLFVYQRPEHTSEAHVLPILTMLRSRGDNALLFLSEGGDASCGSVDLLSAQLYRGNIDRLPPIGQGSDENACAWIGICANAYRLWREAGYGQ